MKAEQFNEVLEAELNRTMDTMGVKAAEYASDRDRLHNFKQAAHLTGETTKQALAGMMVKHTVSIYDMIASNEPFTVEQWTEKISDHINYLILLKAIVVEEASYESFDEGWDLNEAAFKLDTGPDSNEPTRPELKSDLCCNKCGPNPFENVVEAKTEQTVEVIKLPLFPGVEILLPIGDIRP